jgi:hypothetical protein
MHNNVNSPLIDPEGMPFLRCSRLAKTPLRLSTSRLNHCRPTDNGLPTDLLTRVNVISCGEGARLDLLCCLRTPRSELPGKKTMRSIAELTTTLMVTYQYHAKLFSGGPIDTAHQDDVQLVPCHRIINLPNFIRPAQAMMEGARGTYYVHTRGCARAQEHAHRHFEACPNP